MFWVSPSSGCWATIFFLPSDQVTRACRHFFGNPGRDLGFAQPSSIVSYVCMLQQLGHSGYKTQGRQRTQHVPGNCTFNLGIFGGHISAAELHACRYDRTKFLVDIDLLDRFFQCLQERVQLLVRNYQRGLDAEHAGVYVGS